MLVSGDGVLVCDTAYLRVMSSCVIPRGVSRYMLYHVETEPSDITDLYHGLRTCSHGDAFTV